MSIFSLLSDRVVDAPSDMACVACGHAVRKLLDMQNEKARQFKPGDPIMCIICGHLLVVNEDLKLRSMTEEEIHGIQRDAPAMWAEMVWCQRQIRMRR